MYQILLTKLWKELRVLFGTELFRNVMCLSGIRFHLCRLIVFT